MKKLLKPHCVEIEKIKGSRFVADLVPVSTISEAMEFISTLKQSRRDASHICYGLRINPMLSRFSDDGEPRNSAGMPILQRLEAMDLVAGLCAVTRYYGGVKLGVGGLIRAYGRAAAAVLSECECEEVAFKVEVSFAYKYDDTALIAAVLANYDNIESDSLYFESVLTKISIEPELKEQFLNDLYEKTSGRVRIIEEN